MMSHEEAGHPSNRFYIVIAVILAVLTAMEVMVFYVEALAPMLLAILMVLMAAKFALVVMFFMHLKFDSKVLTGVFLWGLFIATSIILALMAIFGKFAG
ncbi:MAG: cytochrome C oxidase subunit IV family protein [Gemmatimonadota bacterium]|nr:cytochrome C oxidase subunit IV family protein [Gemmatimonadota bacterium]